MAARKNKVKLSENWKEKIRTSMLLNRLNNHALGECDMTSTQVDAAKYLLNKVISNAVVEQSVQHSGDFNIGLPWLNQVIQTRNSA